MTQTSITRGNLASGARFSPCDRYRYELWRRWKLRGDLLVFIGLNPSTADENQLDPTLRRVQAFAKRERFAGFLMLNLFAWRSTNPNQLLDVPDPIGFMNDHFIEAWLHESSCIACWGNHRVARHRADQVIALAPRKHRFRCLGTNADGSPKHPLYLPKSTPLVDLPEKLRTGSH